MAISCEDLEALKKGRECIQQMHKLLPVETRDTSPASVVGALLTVCLQHCDSILILLQTGENNASAEALLRPMVESAFRLLWLKGEKKRAKLVTANKMSFPSFSRLLRSVASRHDVANLQSATKSLHDLAHAGMTQLMQHFKEAHKESTPLHVKLGFRLAAMLVAMMAMIACGSFCVFTERGEDQERIAAHFLVYLIGSSVDLLITIAPLAKDGSVSGGTGAVVQR